MITAKDFLRLPYTSDLTEGGIAYACRSLNYTCNRMGGTPFPGRFPAQGKLCS
jgi:hypothetical protein